MVRATRHLAVVGLVLCALTGCASDADSDAVASAEPTASAISSSTPSASASSGSSRLAYQWLAGGGDGIYLTDADGSNPSRIFGDLPGDHIHPDFSADGTSLAFIVAAADSGVVWTANADGSEAKEVAGCAAPCLHYDFADWSPDGDELLLMRYDGPPGEGGIPASSVLERLDLATGEAEVVATSEPNTLFGNPRWSPDGDSYCVTQQVGDETGLTGSAIAVGSMDGGKPTLITEPDEFGAYCDWSPTDNLIVFTTYDLQEFQEADPEHASNLFSVRPDGTDLRALTDYAAGGTRATQPRWTPDGEQILFTKVDGPGMGSRVMAVLRLADGSINPAAGTTYLPGTHPVRSG